jgi:hypothetical protein
MARDVPAYGACGVLWLRLRLRLLLLLLLLLLLRLRLRRLLLLVGVLVGVLLPVLVSVACSFRSVHASGDPLRLPPALQSHARSGPCGNCPRSARPALQP